MSERAAALARRIEATLVLLVVRLALSLVPFRWLWSLLKRLEQHRLVPGSDDLQRSARIAAAVTRASATIPGTTCLVQAVACVMLLRWHGLPATLRIGVARSAAQLAAHAWVESCGVVVIGGTTAELAQYRPLLAAERQA